jgi:Domain of unknown function (DUF4845)
MYHRPESTVRGISLLSTLFVLIGLGFAIVIAARLVPIYLEFQGVSHTLENIAHSGARDEASVLSQLERGFGAADVKTIQPRDVDIMQGNGDMTVGVDYDAVAPFMGNVGFVVHFHKTVTVSGAQGS